MRRNLTWEPPAAFVVLAKVALPNESVRHFGWSSLSEPVSRKSSSAPPLWADRRVGTRPGDRRRASRRGVHRRERAAV